MKNKFSMTRLLSLLLCLALVAAAALTTAAAEAVVDITEEMTPVILSGEGTQEDPYVLGEGETAFCFEVCFLEGDTVYYLINTDETVVGQALLKELLIDGEEGPYGLYVKTVDGEHLDYDVDGHYWAFYINGEYAMTGVDATPVEADTVYAFRAE